MPHLLFTNSHKGRHNQYYWTKHEMLDTPPLEGVSWSRCHKFAIYRAWVPQCSPSPVTYIIAVDRVNQLRAKRRLVDIYYTTLWWDFGLSNSLLDDYSINKKKNLI